MHGAVVTFFDISERLRMQAALRQGELRLAKLVDDVADGVISTGPDDKVVLFNRAAESMFGISARQAIGSAVGRFIARTAGAKSAVEPAKANRAVQELTGKRADGSTFPVEATLSRLATDQGAMTTVVLRDVTELHAARAERQAREALEASNRAKTEFLSRMSHELRTPLNAVLGFAQLLRMDTAGPPSALQLERIRHIERAGAHLLALVNDVLDVSRVDSGQMALTLESVDLASVVDESIALVTTLANDAGVRLMRPEPAGPRATGDVQAAFGDVHVVADRVRLRQVLVNLLSNAVKYNRAEGTVTVSWAAHPDALVLSVADTGHGMEPAQLARLFEPFNRLGAEKTRVEGTGIGLFLSRRLVELMHGELRVDSRVGHGTVATLVLERSDDPASAPLSALPPSQHGTLDASLLVLYAEDNEVNVELVRQVASFRPSVGLRVASNGAQALQMARESRPDMMLVDMHLGDMTGIELAQKLREHPSTAGIPLVALSADALPEQIEGALAMGFEAYLTKPIEFRKLLRVFDGHLQS
ncbi:MAG: ATP-binding protein [Burkholderiaceae bacterium]